MKKTITFMFSVLLVFGIFSACGASETKSDELITINSFDNYVQLQSVQFKSYVGKTNLIQNGNIFSGNYVELEIEHSRQPNWSLTETILYAPRLVFQASDSAMGYNLTDITSVRSFSVDVYNGNDYDAILCFYALGANGIVYDAYADLPAKTLLNAVFPMNAVFNNAGEERCSTFQFAIIDHKVNDTSFLKHYYFDNFQAVRATNGLKSGMEKICDDDEVLLFSEPKDMQYVTTHHTEGAYGGVSVPVGGISYTSVSPIGKALTLKAFGNNPYEQYDLAYFDTTMQRYGIKLAEELVSDLDFTRLGFKDKLCADIYNAHSGLTRGVSLMLEDKYGTIAQTRIRIEPLKKATLLLENVIGLDLKNIVNVYIMFDTYNLFEPADLHINNIRFVKE